MKSWMDLLIEKAGKMNWEPTATDGYCWAFGGKFLIIVHVDTTSLEEAFGTVIDAYSTPSLLWNKVRARDERRVKALEDVMKLLGEM